MFLNGCRLNS